MHRSSILAFVAASALVACKKGDRSFSTQPAAGHVEMTLTCFTDGTLGVDLAPWAVTLPAADAAFTLVNSHNSSVPAVIAGKPNADPFRGAKFTTPNSGKTIIAKPAAGTDSGTYHYSVTATCPIAGGSKTTVIDPDMIIPWKVQ